MAGSLIERTLRVLETLSSEPDGIPLQRLAERLEIPKSAAHRICNELIRLGYARQETRTGHYRLSTRLVALGFRYLGSTGASDVLQPILDRLAAETGELVRLGVIEGDRQTWIAKAQGSRTGLRYDPDMGREAPLRYTASGQAWLASLDDHTALTLLARQDDDPERFGPNAPRTDAELLERLALARERGYTCCVDSSALGTSAFGAVIRHPIKHHPIGVISVAGPSVRLTESRMHELAPKLLQAVEELSHCSQSSQLFTE
ncbi:IclR family transcriptional regulator [Modicisalibacter radicis]|uniref:IclR family transcriptional regulator n=1 Tax=Halomonas sp. EAR18 TaxID=2518972 RepID=UPI00109CB01E|nr:IclR family transcriptional regulator [Halomonas sp. EAR18]